MYPWMLGRGSFEQIWSNIAIFKKSKFIIFHVKVRNRPYTPIKMSMVDMVITTLKQILKDCEIGWSVAIVHTMNFESMYFCIKTNIIRAIKYI